MKKFCFLLVFVLSSVCVYSQIPEGVDRVMILDTITKYQPFWHFVVIGVIAFTITSLLELFVFIGGDFCDDSASALVAILVFIMMFLFAYCIYGSDKGYNCLLPESIIMMMLACVIAFLLPTTSGPQKQKGAYMLMFFLAWQGFILLFTFSVFHYFGIFVSNLAGSSLGLLTYFIWEHILEDKKF